MELNDPGMLPADAARARGEQRAWRRTWRRARRTAAAERGSLLGFASGSLARHASPRRRPFNERLVRRAGRRITAAPGPEVCATYATVIVLDSQSTTRSGIAGAVYSQVMALMHDDPSRFAGLDDVVAALNTLRARERIRRNLKLHGDPALVGALAYHTVTTPGFAQVWLAQQGIDVTTTPVPDAPGGLVRSAADIAEDTAVELAARDAQSLGVLALRKRSEEAGFWSAVVAVSAANRLTVAELFSVAAAAAE